MKKAQGGRLAFRQKLGFGYMYHLFQSPHSVVLVRKGGFQAYINTENGLPSMRLRSIWMLNRSKQLSLNTWPLKHIPLNTSPLFLHCWTYTLRVLDKQSYWSRHYTLDTPPADQVSPSIAKLHMRNLNSMTRTLLSTWTLFAIHDKVAVHIQSTVSCSWWILIG